jgi:hypothetical protein
VAKRSGPQPFAQPAAERRRDIQNPSVSWSPFEFRFHT